MTRPITVVTADQASPLARRVAAELARAGHAAHFVPELGGPEGLVILLDDVGLPGALAAMIRFLPGRATFPNVLLVMERPDGGMLGEGVRDVVAPEDAPAAVEALLRAGPPVLFTRLRQEIVGEFLPAHVADLRKRAREKQAIARDCVDLVRASAFLEKRLVRIHRRYTDQAIDELLVMEGQIEAYLTALDEAAPSRLARLPAFPAGSATGGALGKREPRYRRAGDEIADALDWLRQAGLAPALGKAGHEAMSQAAETLRGKPLQGLRELRSIVEREIALRLAQIERLQAQVNPMTALAEGLLARRGLGLVPPGIALPASVELIVRSLAQPPAEIYVTFCLDLRDLKLKPCAEVLAEIARGLSWTAPRPAAAAPSIAASVVTPAPPLQRGPS